jgi:hypothetical protein
MGAARTGPMDVSVSVSVRRKVEISLDMYLRRV